MNPRAKTVKIINNYQLEIEFTNGEIKRFDLSPLLTYPIYQSLKNTEYFKKVFISNRIVQWPNEEDISPDTLYVDARLAG